MVANGTPLLQIGLTPLLTTCNGLKESPALWPTPKTTLGGAMVVPTSTQASLTCYRMLARSAWATRELTTTLEPYAKAMTPESPMCPAHGASRAWVQMKVDRQGHLASQFLRAWGASPARLNTQQFQMALSIHLGLPVATLKEACQRDQTTNVSTHTAPVI